jgi:glycosyltransferase involved in cell wall biosynthesis
VDEPTPSTNASAPVTITACIIARDEAQSLPDCLASVSFCKEIVLVDAGSTDATVEIARAAGARVVEHPWRGFAAQRNVALDHAHGEWVLEIDADERISGPLRAEIEAFLADPPPDVELAGLPSREVFLGRTLGPSAKYPKYRHRLLRRGAYRHDERRTVHEGLVPEGRVHPFEGDLIHLLATSWGEACSDAWRYARLEVGQMRAPRTPATIVRGAILRPGVKFLYRLTIDGGWRDGWAGAAKIALDCATDSLVWTRYLFGRRGSERGDSGVEVGRHYGAWRARRGSVRVIAVAAGAAESATAARWLEGAASGGADVALIAPDPTPESDVRVRRIDRMGALTLIRALDAEEQLRTIDAVVAFGRRARLMLHFVPPGLRGHMGDLSSDTDPAALAWDASARREAVPV